MYKKRKTLVLMFILSISLILTGCIGNGDIDEVELEKNANGILNNLENYYENENLAGIAEILSTDFIYYEERQDGSLEADKQLFLNEQTEEHFTGYDVVSFEISNRVVDVKSSTKVEVVGNGSETYKNPDTGEEFNQGPTDTKFIIEKVNGEWLVTRFEVYLNLN